MLAFGGYPDIGQANFNDNAASVIELWRNEKFVHSCFA